MPSNAVGNFDDASDPSSMNTALPEVPELIEAVAPTEVFWDAPLARLAAAVVAPTAVVWEAVGSDVSIAIVAVPPSVVSAVPAAAAWSAPTSKLSKMIRRVDAVLFRKPVSPPCDPVAMSVSVVLFSSTPLR